MADPIIELRDVHFSWSKREQEILCIPEMTVERGEHLLIQGASGSGKTTLLNLLAGINIPNSGSVKILGAAFEGLNSRQRDQFRADHLGVIFQQFNLLPYLSLLENVQLPCWFSDRKRANAGDIEETSRRLLAHLHISAEMVDKPVGKLSVGQQQRVAVARALIGRPEIVIADEPTSALDANNRDSFLELLFQEVDQQESTLVFVSHDPYIAGQFDRVIELTAINQAGEIH
jgi:putative ABC transport system ATP-binding protein